MVTALSRIRQEIERSVKENGRPSGTVALLAVTKQRSHEQIIELIKDGQRLFGENRVQEAMVKWPEICSQYSDIALHLIGFLQTNKVAKAIALFDVIQTLDSLKLAEKLAREEERQNKKCRFFIAVNIGNELQKSGISPDKLSDFISELKKNYPLNVTGLMCIPPKDKDPSIYFQKLANLAEQFHLPEISMGMSNDFTIAIAKGATIVRIGIALFETRKDGQSN